MTMAPVTTEEGTEIFPPIEAPSEGVETADDGGEETEAPEPAETEKPDINTLLDALPDEEFEKLERVYRTKQSASDSAAAAANKATEENLSRWVDQGGPQRELRTLLKKAADSGDDPDEQAISDVLAGFGTTRDLRAVNIMHDLARSELPKDYRVPQEDVKAVETAIDQYRAGKGSLDAIYLADVKTLARAIAETELLPQILRQKEAESKAKQLTKEKADAVQTPKEKSTPTSIGGGAPGKRMSWAEIDKKWNDAQWREMLATEEGQRLAREADEVARG